MLTFKRNPRVLIFLFFSPFLAAWNSGDDSTNVNGFFGSFSTKIPIAVPEYHGLEPKLALTYGSEGGNSFAGVGWSLSGFSFIERAQPRGGTPKYNSTDIYYLDGMELVPDTTYGGSHSTRILNYARITEGSNSWTVVGTNGNTATYSPVFVTSRGTFRWMITSMADTRGNVVTYSYYSLGDDHVVPSGISYNGTQITFYREVRPDPIRFATGGNISINSYRLKTIDIKVSGNRARAYGLTYASGKTRSFLESVTQYGKTSSVSGSGVISGGISLPPFQVTYNDEPDSFQSDVITGTMSYSYKSSNPTPSYGDFNGDGLADLLYRRDGRKDLRVLLSNGSGYGADTYWGSYTYDMAGSHPKSDFGDFNGDGKLDFVYRRNGKRELRVKLSNGNGFDPETVWCTYTYTAAGSIPRAYFVDLDGDGKTDFIYRRSNTKSFYARLSTGSSFGSEVFWGSYNYTVGGTDPHARFADLNGDGMADFLYKRKNTKNLHVLLSTGSGFAPDTYWGSFSYSAAEANPPATMADVNGDGKVDFCYRRKDTKNLHVLISNGMSFQSDAYWGAYTYSFANAPAPAIMDMNGDRRADFVYRRSGVLDIRVKLSTGSSFAPETVWGTYSKGIASNAPNFGYADLNGDGRRDFVYRDKDTYIMHALLSYPQDNHRLKTVSNGIGGTTTVGYTPSTSWSNTLMPIGMVLQTVTSVTNDDGRGYNDTVNYDYADGLWSFDERRFLGFGKVTSVLDAQGNYAETWYLQEEGSISKPLYTWYKDNQGNIFNYSSYEYTYNSSPPYNSLLTSRWDLECNQTAACRTSLVQFTYDAYANVTETRDWGDYFETGDEVTHYRSYAPNTSSYITGLPALESSYEGLGTGGTLMELTLYTYDSNTSWAQPPTEGNVTHIQKWDSANGGYVTKDLDYDTYGNLIAETDERGYTTTITFDSAYHVYPVGTTNPLGQTLSRTWDTALGLELSSTDANGAVTSTTYDALGRRQTITWPNSSVTQFQYLYQGNPSLQRIREIKPDGSGDGLWEETWQDGLGRVWKVVQEGGITRETLYSGTSERVWKVTHPYNSGSPRWTTYAYDGANRLRTVTHPDGAMTEVVYGMDANNKPYEANYDEMGNERLIWKDTRGRVIQVRENNGGALYYTNYQYDVLGRMIGATNDMGHTTSFTWDSLGRKRMMVDPDMGTWVYDYDDAGLMTSQTDARSQATTYGYDQLGRMTSKTNHAGDTTYWHFDENGYGSSKGRLTRVVYPAGSTAYYWNSSGLEYRIANTVSGITKNFDRTYDNLGRLATLTYPDGETITYGYDSNGKMDTVSGYVTAMDWSASNQLLSMTYSNGTTNTFTYDSDRLWLESSNVKKGSTTRYNATYNYDDAARMASVSSTTNSLSNLSFDYDDLSRLTGVTGAMSEGFTYDSLGNMTWNQRHGTNEYNDAGHVHALTKAGSVSYAYDANGSMTSRGSQTLTWDTENRLANIAGAGISVDYVYGAGTERIRKVSASTGVTDYFGALLERQNGSDIKYYFAGPIRVAKKQGSTRHWYHADHLGSVRLITDANGNAAHSYDYSAFGEVVYDSGSAANTVGFNGHTADDDVGLVYMKARYYDPVLGRFISADTIVPDPGNPQALNRYAFVYNNPVTNIDPTGHAPVAAAVLSAVITTSVTTSTVITATAWIGAGLSVAGYYTENPWLSSLGSVMLGFAGGYANPGNFSSLTGGVMGATGAALTSPVSPLGPDVKQAVGWAFSAAGQVSDFRSAVEFASYNAANVAAEMGISYIAEKMGMDGAEFNVALTGLSLAGNMLVGSRYRGVQNGGQNGPYEKFTGVSSRGWLGLPFDVVDIVLGYQGLPTASAYEYMFTGNHELPLLGFSLGSLDANNLAGMGVAGNSVTAVSLPAFNGGAPGVQVYIGNMDPVNGFSVFGKMFTPYSTVQDAGLGIHAKSAYPILNDNCYKCP